MAATQNLVAKVLLPGMSTPHVLASSAFYTCTTEAATAAKTISDVDFTLVAGMTITVKFANTNTAQNPTLAINGGSAIPINLTASEAAGITASTSWAAGAVISMTYDGTSWIMNDFPVWVTDILKENDAMIYKGTYTATSTQAIDPNAFSVDPTLETDARGWTYKVTGVTSTNKYFGNQVVENGDMIIINTDNAPSTTQSNYDVIQTNIDMEALAHQHYYTPSGTIATVANSGTDAIYTPSGSISTPNITVTTTNTGIAVDLTQDASSTIAVVDSVSVTAASGTTGDVVTGITLASATGTNEVVTSVEVLPAASGTTGDVVTDVDVTPNTYGTGNVLTGVSVSVSAGTTGDVVTDVSTTTDSVTWSVSVDSGVMSFSWGGNKTLVDSVSMTMGDIKTDTGDITTTTGDVKASVSSISATMGDFTMGDIKTDTGDITTTTGDVKAFVSSISATMGDITTTKTNVIDAVGTVTAELVDEQTTGTGVISVATGIDTATSSTPTFSGDGVDITFTGTRDQTEAAL